MQEDLFFQYRDCAVAVLIPLATGRGGSMIIRLVVLHLVSIVIIVFVDLDAFFTKKELTCLP